MLAASAIGPLSVIPATFLLAYLWNRIHPNAENLMTIIAERLSHLVITALLTVYGVLYAYGITVFYGVPVYLWLRRHGRHGFQNIMLAGQIPVFPIHILLFDNWTWSSYLVIAYYAAVVSTTCWLIGLAVESITKATATRSTKSNFSAW